MAGHDVLFVVAADEQLAVLSRRLEEHAEVRIVEHALVEHERQHGLHVVDRNRAERQAADPVKRADEVREPEARDVDDLGEERLCGDDPPSETLSCDTMPDTGPDS